MRKFLLITIIALTGQITNGAEIIRFATLDYCPLICNAKTEPLKRKGIMVELLQQIYKSEGYIIQVSLMPFKRAIREVTEGQYDGLIAGDKFLAPELIYPHSPLLVNKAQIFTTQASTWKYSGIDSLKEVHLLAVKEFGYANSAIEKYIASAPSSSVTRMDAGESYTQRGIELLLKNAVDAYIDGHLVFQYVAGMTKAESKFRAASDTLGEFKNYVSFSPHNMKRSKKLVEILERNFDSIVKNGKYREILKSYGIKSDE